jgi:hypothetical protein
MTREVSASLLFCDSEILCFSSDKFRHILLLQPAAEFFDQENWDGRPPRHRREFRQPPDEAYLLAGRVLLAQNQFSTARNKASGDVR